VIQATVLRRRRIRQFPLGRSCKVNTAPTSVPSAAERVPVKVPYPVVFMYCPVPPITPSVDANDASVPFGCAMVDPTMETPRVEPSANVNVITPENGPLPFV